MQVNEQQTADKFSIIGHSIGAHAAGDVGTRIPGLTRITGNSASIVVWYSHRASIVV